MATRMYSFPKHILFLVFVELTCNHATLNRGHLFKMDSLTLCTCNTGYSIFITNMQAH